MGRCHAEVAILFYYVRVYCLLFLLVLPGVAVYFHMHLFLRVSCVPPYSADAPSTHCRWEIMLYSASTAAQLSMENKYSSLLVLVTHTWLLLFRIRGFHVIACCVSVHVYVKANKQADEVTKVAAFRPTQASHSLIESCFPPFCL